MKTLTLKQPWAYAITDLGKRVENRTWKPPKDVIGQRIAIHAGKSYDAEGHIWIEQMLGITLPAGLHTGAIVATVRLLWWTDYDDSVWFVGPVGWVLADVRKLAHPVPCRGHLGLWDVPADVLRRVEFAK